MSSLYFDFCRNEIQSLRDRKRKKTAVESGKMTGRQELFLSTESHLSIRLLNCNLLALESTA